MRIAFLGWILAASAAGLVACSDSGDDRKASRAGVEARSAAQPPPTRSGEPPEPAVPPPPPAEPAAAALPASQPAGATAPSQDPRAQAINTADLTTAGAEGWSAGLVRAQVLLARAHVSPGVIDGRNGDNFRNAVAAFEVTHNHAPDGRLDSAMWTALTSADPAPVVTSYVISAADVAGPFSPKVPSENLRELSKLPEVGYTSPQEMLAERFHMDETLLKALNPGADFGAAGTRILVAAIPAQAPPMVVSTVEVDKTARQVRAFDAHGALLATYPATVGSAERPAPTGRFKVTGVARHPTYTYDPARLTYGDRSLGKVTVKPGPNNPVGVVWIDLNAPTYGIHGAPEPQLVGKVASHGCVRLTNWDAEDLAAGVKPGVKVVFVGADAPAGAGKRRAR